MLEGKSRMRETIVKSTSLRKYYPVKRGLFYKITGWIKAVDNVSLEIEEGKTLGLVGESGCGKTTLGRIILRLIEPDSGEIFFKGTDITHTSHRDMRSLRQDMQIVFQDPYNSLDPRFTVSRILSEGLDAFGSLDKKKTRKRVKELLELVGLSSNSVNRYPHEFSGGQRQRIGIARAISLNPSFLVLDEPVSSLDVSVQAQIINLVYDLQEKLNLSYLFIAHDLNIIRHVSDDIAVMYSGKIVEAAKTIEIFTNPSHPYTRLLLEAMPVADPAKRKEKKLLKGEVSSLISLRQRSSGCRFRTRCPYAIGVCSKEEPVLKEITPGHSSACHI